jgi:GDP-4-dehydro-6-deoxy-D-mannose reductase
VTGGSGFVGSYLVEFLKSRASQIAVLATRKISRQDSGVEYHQAEIRDTKKVRAVILQSRPDQVYHLAAMSAVDLSWKEPLRTYEVNLFGAHNVFSAAMELSPPPKILNVSTAQVYAPASHILTEHSPVAPENPYAASKAMTELLAFQYGDHAPGGIITARSFNHTGPGQQPGFVLPSIAKQFAEIAAGLRPPKLGVGNLNVIRDFTDVRDVIRAYCMLLESGRTGEIYNVCSGVAVLLSDVIEIFEAKSGVKAKVEIDPSKVRSKEVAQIRGDPGKIHNETGWFPRIPLEKTLEDLLDYWRSRCRTQNTILNS